MAVQPCIEWNPIKKCKLLKICLLFLSPHRLNILIPLRIQRTFHTPSLPTHPLTPPKKEDETLENIRKIYCNCISLSIFLCFEFTFTAFTFTFNFVTSYSTLQGANFRQNFWKGYKSSPLDSLWDSQQHCLPPLLQDALWHRLSV